MTSPQSVVGDATVAPRETSGRITAILRATHVPARTRLLLSLVAGLAGAGVTIQSNLRQTRPRDFAQIWFAARAVLAGQDPYALIGPGKAFDWAWPFLYPLPAALVALPLAVFTKETASVVFFAIGAACFAWALMEHGYAPLFGFLSGSLHYAAETAQWSPLFAASLAIPAIGLLFAAKPTIGLAYFVAKPTSWAVIGAGTLLVVSSLIQPTWGLSWFGAIAENNARWLPYHPYQLPIFYPGGFLVLLALLRWRRPEARLLAVLACVPQTGALYETVPLFLIPRSFGEVTLLVFLSYVQANVFAFKGELPWGQAMHESGTLIVWLLYLPATLMLLRRPNEGTVPAWLDRRLASWPPILRGSPSDA